MSAEFSRFDFFQGQGLSRSTADPSKEYYKLRCYLHLGVICIYGLKFSPLDRPKEDGLKFSSTPTKIYTLVLKTYQIWTKPTATNKLATFYAHVDTTA